MDLKLGKDGFEQSKDRITVESFRNGSIPISVSCDRNECCETAESMERKACDYLGKMIGQPVEPNSYGTNEGDHIYSKGNITYYDKHYFSINLKK